MNPTQGRILSLLGMNPTQGLIRDHTDALARRQSDKSKAHFPQAPTVGVESRRVVRWLNKEGSAPRGQAAWQLTGGARSETTPG